VKGDLRMARVLVRSVRDRERRLRSDLVIGYGLQRLRLSIAESERIVEEARRRYRRHNAARRFVDSEVFVALAASGRGDLKPGEVRDRVRHEPEVRAALEWMWPVLTPADLLHDLFGSHALLRSAGRGVLTVEEAESLFHARRDPGDDIVFTNDDAPLLDEARAILGPRPRKRRAGEPDDELRTYGHIVVDEAQDLSPMQLRMLQRRSLNGSMTIVGDIAQATGQWAHQNWDEILEHLPQKRPARRAELTIGYRLPAPNMALAARVLRVAAPDLKPPRSIREDGTPPRIVRVAPMADLMTVIVEAARVEVDAVDPGQVAIVCPQSLADAVSEAFDAAGLEHGQATRHGLDQQITVVPVGLVKGLELDAAVVVEPAAIVDEEAQGLRALYVALTRATKRLAIVHQRALPEALLE
jgi:DNA helicase IV